MTENPIPFKRLPLRNVELLHGLTYRIQHRGAQNQCIGLFYGPTGIGKSEAATAVRNMTDAVILTAATTWSRSFMLKKLLAELGEPDARGAPAALAERAIAYLIETPDRPLIIDEADKLAKDDCLEALREVSDAARMPLILVGEERLVNVVKRIPRVDGRVLIRKPGVSCDLGDARKLVDYFAPGIAIDDRCLELIRTANNRRPRLIVSDCERIVEWARAENAKAIDAAAYQRLHQRETTPRFEEMA